MWIIWAIAAAITAALVIILTKAGLKNVDSNLAFAIQSVLIFCIAWGVIAWQGNYLELKKIENNAWILLILAGIATALSTLFSYKALANGPAAYVATIERTSLVLSVILSIVFLKEKITWQLVVGASVMIAGAVLIALSESSGK